MDAMRAPGAVAAGQGVLEAGQDLGPAQQAQRTGRGWVRDIEMPRKYWMMGNTQRQNPLGAQRR